MIRRPHRNRELARDCGHRPRHQPWHALYDLFLNGAAADDGVMGLQVDFHRELTGLCDYPHHRPIMLFWWLESTAGFSMDHEVCRTFKISSSRSIRPASHLLRQKCPQLRGEDSLPGRLDVPHPGFR